MLRLTTGVERDLKDLISEQDELLSANPEPLVSYRCCTAGLIGQERSSFLGTFVRRIHLTLRKHSFEETAALARRVSKWCGEDKGASWKLGLPLAFNRARILQSGF